MEVYYGTNFWGHPKDADPMQKIELDQEFTWGDLTGFIPVLSYEIIPEIAENRFRLQDVGNGDQPRRLNQNASAAVGVIGGADGPTAVFVAGKKKDGQKRVSISALYFEPIAHTNWKPVFMEKEREDMSLHIGLLEQ